jgi:hypothetical protein
LIGILPGVSQKTEPEVGGLYLLSNREEYPRKQACESRGVTKGKEGSQCKDVVL